MEKYISYLLHVSVPITLNTTYISRCYSHELGHCNIYSISCRKIGMITAHNQEAVATNYNAAHRY